MYMCVCSTQDPTDAYFRPTMTMDFYSSFSVVLHSAGYFKVFRPAKSKSLLFVCATYLLPDIN